jgi:ketosteroid isomerase-like protein
MFRAFVLILALACPLFAGDASEGVREAADGWRASLVKQDKAGLDRYLADELIYIHAGGKTQTKAEYIEAVTTGPSHYESFNKTDIKIRVYGKVAVLSGYIDVKTVGRDSYRVRTLEIYKETNGQWQLADKESVRISRRGSSD